MRKRIIALFAVLLVSTVASAGIITISAANDKSSTYNEKAAKDTPIVSQAESSKTNDFNYTQALSKVSKSNEVKRIIIKEIPVEKLTPETKQDYYHKMLNAVDYYNTVSGSFVTNYLSQGSQEKTVVSYQVDMVNNVSHEIVKGPNDDSEVYVDKDKLIYVNNSDKSVITSNQIFTKVDELAGYNDDYVMRTQSDIKKAKAEFEKVFADDKRITVDENGDKHYLNRLDLTNLCISSSHSLLPQGLTFGYLSNQDMWEISGDTKYLGRDAVVIKGTAEDYGKKFNTATFEMIVDKETGILLELQGYDENGEPSSYIKTTDISFEQPEVKTYSASKYSDYGNLARE